MNVYLGDILLAGSGGGDSNHLLDITLVGGGGGGGGAFYCNYYGGKQLAGGGGGGGGVIKTCMLDTCKQYTVIVGQGGSGGYGTWCRNGHPGEESEVTSGCPGGDTCFTGSTTVIAKGGCGGGPGTVDCGKGGDSGNGCSGGNHFNCNYQCRYNNASGGGGGAGGNGADASSWVDSALGGDGYLGYGYGGNGHAGADCGCPERTPITCGNGGSGGPNCFPCSTEACLKGKDGYPGVVEVCYPIDGRHGVTSATGGNCCYECDGYCVHRFTSDGTFCIID